MVEILRHNLEVDGHVVHSEAASDWGVIEARTLRPDLVITSLELAQETEGRLLLRLRMDHERLPVLVIGSRPEDGDNLRGFRLGVDDYVLRPTTVGEVLRRIERLLDRTRVPALGDRVSAAPSIIFGEIEVRPAARVVLKRGETVPLRLKEFDLLMALVCREGAVASRADLLRGIWGYRTLVATRTVDNHIGELRAKLEDNPARPRHILTVRKVGYRLQR
jgi:DNA-binding response OmpR family regulator